MSFQADKVADHITKWLIDYTNSAGIKAFVVGVSGGIDSAVTAALCARSGLPTFIVEMPIRQSKSELSRSNELCNQLTSTLSNVHKITIELDDVFELLKTALPQLESHSSELTLANARARLRMTTLYAIASENDAIVVGTGNKIEDFGVGFYTKYGDGGVDISPIADLVKTEVYLIGALLKVPLSIQKAAPTDGLWGDDRNDEDQIGASYPELELAMRQTAEFKNGVGSPAYLTGREAEVFEIYSRLNKANQHKMQPIPVCKIPR
jgi:NAD+ synthase